MKAKITYLSKLFTTISVLIIANLGMSGVVNAQNACGGGDSQIVTSIDLGCLGKGNSIVDLTFAIIRFLSYGVGLVVATSLIVAGLQYIGSQGNPENTNNAINRIRRSVIALIIYIFAFAILNYVVPGTVLGQ
jgi:Type IV secretion system pilin